MCAHGCIAHVRVCVCVCIMCFGVFAREYATHIIPSFALAFLLMCRIQDLIGSTRSSSLAPFISSEPRHHRSPVKTTGTTSVRRKTRAPSDAFSRLHPVEKDSDAPRNIAAAPAPIPPKKFVFYSGHDTTIMVRCCIWCWHLL